MSLLLIEDDPMIGHSLCRALGDAGFPVDWRQDGVSGQAAIEQGDYRLVLLDLGLPGKGGLEVLREVRRQGKQTPLIIITARDGEDDRVDGLESGADDYLPKPFSIKELQARIHAVLRRPALRPQRTVQGGDISIDLDTQEASYRGRTLLLHGRELALLQMLTERPGFIFSRQQIEQRLYAAGDSADSNIIDVLIHQLRRKFDNEIIRNVRGVGWMVAK